MTPPTNHDRFHDGELTVQRRASVERTAAIVARNIVSSLTPEFTAFLGAQPFVVIAGADRQARVWASLLVGGVGFARALDEHRLLLAQSPGADDPLAAAFDDAAAPIGILAIEPQSRSRIRVNGRAERTPDGLLVSVEEAFGNCPKFIRRRLPVERLDAPDGSRHAAGRRLTAAHAEMVGAADTFFIASTHPERGADASHRGGPPGFVEVSRRGDRVTFPDYPGNRMFQTLGNLSVDPRVGLLIIDWESGSALHLSGRAEIVWEEKVVRRHAGAERLVAVEIDAVRERPLAMPARWSPIDRAPRSEAVTSRRSRESYR